MRLGLGLRQTKVRTRAIDLGFKQGSTVITGKDKAQTVKEF